jgi:phosphoadenosine phosphosulfate reductase
MSEAAIRPSDESLKALNDSLEAQQPWEVLAHALARYPESLILACSFGAEDVALVDMIHKINPRTPLFYLDTDFLFPETYEVRDRIIEKYGLLPSQVIQVKSLLTPEQQAAQYGDALWLRDPDLCCHVRKIQPLMQILDGYSAWVTGIRRTQGPTRAYAGVVEWDHKFALVKFNPLAKWSAEDVWTYLRLHDVPYNVLHDRNYPSIGCTHCTAPVLPGENARSGRWKNFGKTECGLHK